MKLFGIFASAALAIAAFSFAGPGKGADAPADSTSLEGQAAPDVSLETIDGKAFKLSDLKGSVVVMDYWATWCPPCRKSLPHIEELSKNADLAGKGLKIFAINSKEPKEKAEKFLKENNYSFAVPLDPSGSFGKSYLVRGIPTTVVVGRDGNIRKVFVGFDPENSPKELHDAITAALDAK